MQPLRSSVLLLGLLVPAAWLFACAGDGDGSAHDIVHQGCSNNAECEGGRCVEGLPGGLCTRNCSGQDQCPEGTVCADTEAAGGVCLFTCSRAGECTDLLGSGYTCDSESNLATGEDVDVCIDS